VYNNVVENSSFLHSAKNAVSVVCAGAAATFLAFSSVK